LQPYRASIRGFQDYADCADSLRLQQSDASRPPDAAGVLGPPSTKSAQSAQSADGVSRKIPGAMGSMTAR